MDLISISLVGIGIVVLLALYLQVKGEKQNKKNLLRISDDQLIVVPAGRPVVDDIKGLFAFATGKVTGVKGLNYMVENLKKDRNGSTKYKVLQGSFFGFHSITVWNVELARAILFAKDTDLVKSNALEIQNRFLGDSIILASGDQWKTHKTALSPAFKWDHIQQVLPEFIRIVGELVDQWQNETTSICVHPWIQRATLDAIGSGGFGFQFKAMREKRTSELENYESLMKEFLNPMHFFERLDKLTGGFKRINGLFDKFEEFMLQLVNNKRAEIQAAGDSWQPKDILDFLIASNESNGLTDTQIIRNMNTFFTAGHETTAGALSCAIHYLALHPEIQTRAREEVLSICADHDPTCDDIKKMEFVHQCIKETLRLSPPALGTVRTTERDIQLGDLFVCKGETLIVNTYLIQRDPEYWGPDADEFSPDRFAPENSKGRNTYAWMPFSIGPRQCIGNNFAMLEMRSFLAVLLRQFEFLPDPECKVEFANYMGVVLHPPPGCKLLVKPTK